LFADPLARRKRKYFRDPDDHMLEYRAMLHEPSARGRDHDVVELAEMSALTDSDL